MLPQVLVLGALAATTTATAAQGSSPQPVSPASPITTLEKRENCWGGNCPHRGIVDLAWRRDGFHDADHWHIRYNDCGECNWIKSSEDGCAEFYACGRKQGVCIDWRSGRGMRVWHDNGDKECYGVEVETFCDKNYYLYYFTDKRACNW